MTLVSSTAKNAVLANGARLIAVELPTAHSVVVTAHLRTGSRYED